MKKLIIFSNYIIISIILLNCSNANGQSSTTNHIGTGVEYLGWSNAYNLNFKTNNTPVMLIMGNGTNNGYVEIGNYGAPFNFIPQSQLHQYKPDGVNVYCNVPHC